MITLTKSNEEMADVFDEISSFFETISSPIDMDGVYVRNVKVINDLYCGTPACMGSWLTYYYRDKPKPKYSEYHTNKLKGLPLTFWAIGAECLIRELGIKSNENFTDSYIIAKWAGENPEIWGNEFGKCMFYKGEAYLPRNSYPTDIDKVEITAQDIARHFANVAKRLRV